MENPLGILTGEKDLRISIERNDIILLSVGVFVAMLAALLIAKNL